MPFDYNPSASDVDLAKIGLEWGYQGSYGTYIPQNYIFQKKKRFIDH